MFTDETLNEIKERISMIDLVGEYVQLKKSGTGYLGLCPFHSEKTPSFHVQPLKKICYCFGCHKGGNPFRFIMEMEGLKFPEAVERLAKRTGVRIEEVRKGAPPKPQEVRNRERLVEVNEWAAKFYHWLLTERPEYKEAREYVKKRGLTEATIKRFRIGVAPKGWNTLMTQLTKKGFNFQELLSSGLIVQKEKEPGEGYDRFRDRLMFPITDPEGNTIGFGGRVLPGNDAPAKYMNTPESPLFQKRRVIYGLYENMRGIRKKGEAIVVEGYMDVVGLAQAGVDNAIASMGTALTEEHCLVLRQVTRKVVTVFDPDEAGTRASKSSVPILLSTGMFGRDLTLPDGLDPDEFALAHGAEKFYELCKNAPRQITKLLKEIASRGPLSEDERAKLIETFTPILIASRNLPDRAIFWDNLSLVLGVSHAALRDIVQGATRHKAPAETKKPVPIRAGAPARTPAPRRHPDPLGLEFLEAALRCKEEFFAIPADTWVGGIKDARLKDLLKRLREASEESQYEAILEEIVDKETEPRLVAASAAALLTEKAEPADPAPLRALAERLTQRKKELEIMALSAQVRLAQQMGNEQELLALLAKLNELRAGH